MRTREFIASLKSLPEKMKHNSSSGVEINRLEKPIYYYGTTRFSVFNPNSPDWRLTRTQGATDPQLYEKMLFSDSRMEPRVRIFCDIAAPIYQRMAESHNFYQLVFYSPRMPSRWKDELEEASTKYPVLKLIPVDTEKLDMSFYIKQSLVNIEEELDSFVYMFRIDDDDILSVDYLDQVKPLVIDQHVGFAVSFADGYAGLFENNQYVEIRKHVQALSSMGQGVIGRWFAEKSELELPRMNNHNKTHYNRTVLLNAQRSSFIQTRHTGQDTALLEGNGGMDLASQRREVKSKFERLKTVVEREKVIAEFPSIEKYLAKQNVDIPK